MCLRRLVSESQSFDKLVSLKGLSAMLDSKLTLANQGAMSALMLHASNLFQHATSNVLSKTGDFHFYQRLFLFLTF